jgi:probable O-glycosylation ligase (exosortase A-associated)
VPSLKRVVSYSAQTRGQPLWQVIRTTKPRQKSDEYRTFRGAGSSSQEFARIYALVLASDVATALLHNRRAQSALARFSTMIRTLIFLAVFIPGFLAALRSRYVALLLYLWFALFRPEEWVYVDISSLRLSLILGAVLMAPVLFSIAGSITAAVTGVPPPPRLDDRPSLFPNVTHPLSIGMMLFLLSALLSQIGAVSPEIGWVWVDFLARLLVVCLLLVTLTSEAKRLVGAMGVIAGSLGIHAAKAGLAYLLAGGERFADGLSGSFVDNNGYALGTVMIMPLLVAAAQNVDVVYQGRGHEWVRRSLYAGALLCTFAVIGTYSRGGFVALTAAGLVFVLLQRRRYAGVVGLLSFATVLLLVVPIPQGYVDRLQTIQTYNQIGEESAQSRPHFWSVGLQMVAARPMGVGLRQFEEAYDQYDFSFGKYGSHRAVHSSHVQVLAELGYFGAAAWTGLFAYAYFACLRVRARSRAPHLEPRTRQFLFTMANGFLTSMTGFVVGGAFLSLALNDLTWLTFGMVAALDRVSLGLCEETHVAPSGTSGVSVAPAFRSVAAIAPLKAGRR